MGDLAPDASPWLPEDDLLLRNAVEAGASLECLAKGAVSFSRKYNLEELQKRWHSLLFDENISTQASAKFLEIDIGNHNPNSHRSNKFCSFKGKESVSFKRKHQSLRSHYHAKQKRVCNVPSLYGDHEFSMLVAASECTINGDVDEHLIARQPEYFLENGPEIQASIYDVPEAKCGIRSNFLGMHRKCSSASAADGASVTLRTSDVDSGALGSSESLTAIQEGCLVMESLDNRLSGGSCCRDIMHGHDLVFKENTCNFKIPSSSQEKVASPMLPLSSHFEEPNMQNKSTLDMKQENHHQINKCAGFDVCKVLESESVVCNGASHHQEYASPVSETPICVPSVQTNKLAASIVEDFNDLDHGVCAPGMPSADIPREVHRPNCELFEPNICDEICLPPNEDDFAGISMNLTNTEGSFFIDLDEKTIIDKSCFDGLNNFLMSSPTGDQQDHVKNHSINVDTVEKCHAIADVSSTGESKKAASEVFVKVGGGNGNGLTSHATKAPSEVISAYGPLQGPVVCTLNTEDPEIPCNNHLIPPAKGHAALFLINLNRKSEDLSVSPSKNFVDRKVNILNGERGGRETSQNNLIPSIGQEGTMQPFPRARSEPLDGVSLPGTYNKGYNSAKASDTSAVGASFSATAILLEDDTVTHGAAEHRNYNKCQDRNEEKVVQTSFHATSHMADEEMVLTNEVRPICHVDGNSSEILFPGQVEITSMSDIKEKYSDCENELPNVSDVEAMILDMDLSSDDQESYFYSREALRYQHLVTKKAIIRLEQGASSYIQRSIASNGAFAVIYGRYLKHYINKCQVLLGRGTRESYVDIDLQREGRANKISRRQAIIQMDEDGIFSLRNVGRFPLKVNDKEVFRGKCCTLRSGCLIEVKGMSFIFDVNQTSVRQYLSNKPTMEKKVQISEFDGLRSKIS